MHSRDNFILVKDYSELFSAQREACYTLPSGDVFFIDYSEFICTMFQTINGIWCYKKGSFQ